MHFLRIAIGLTSDRATVGYWLGAHKTTINYWYWFDAAPMCYSNWNHNGMINLVKKTIIFLVLIDLL